jgi:predicted regulator of Ras-like GTPase activity (Roadblock/LC7/MglB family)
MAIQGDLKDMDLTALISVNCNEGNQARLRVQHENDEAFVFFDDGQIVHIELGDQIGERVIDELLTWEDGSFELDMQVPPPAHTVQTSWSNLVLDGMRRIDENAAAQQEQLSEQSLENWLEDVDLAQHEEVNEMAKLNDLLQEMANEMPGIISTDVVGMDGLSIAHYATSPEFDAEAAAAQFALVMKLVQKTIGQLKAGAVEDNLVTTNHAYVITRFLGSGSYYLSIAVNKETASLGNVRLISRQYADLLWDAIPRPGQ